MIANTTRETETETEKRYRLDRHISAITTMDRRAELLGD